MKIAVVGSTRGTGPHVVKQALERGHEVVAVARRPEAVTERHPALEVRVADAKDPEALQRAFVGVDRVISTIGPSTREILGRTTLFSETGAAMVRAAQANALDRLLVVTSGGVEHDDPSFGAFYKWVVKPVLLGRAYADALKLEELLRATSLRWTAVRPTQLTDGPLTKQYRVSPRYAPPKGLQISRADLAHFLIDTAEQDTWVHGTPTLAY